MTDSKRPSAKGSTGRDSKRPAAKEEAASKRTLPPHRPAAKEEAPSKMPLAPPRPAARTLDVDPAWLEEAVPGLRGKAAQSATMPEEPRVKRPPPIPAHPPVTIINKPSGDLAEGDTVPQGRRPNVRSTRPIEGKGPPPIPRRTMEVEMEWLEAAEKPEPEGPPPNLRPKPRGKLPPPIPREEATSSRGSKRPPAKKK